MRNNFGDRLKKITQTICLFWLTIQPGFALEVTDVPQPLFLHSNWIADVAEILDRDTKIQINQDISQLETDKGDRIYVVTVSQIPERLTYREFATALLSSWQIVA